MANEEPKLKRNVGIGHQSETDLVIRFHAHAAIATKMSKFGVLVGHAHGHEYRLEVDPRFDFKEVLAYLLSFNEHAVRQQ